MKSYQHVFLIRKLFSIFAVAFKNDAVITGTKDTRRKHTQREDSNLLIYRKDFAFILSS